MCFPLKNSPHAPPGRKTRFLNESVFWRHPGGGGVFLAVKATWKSSERLCTVSATASLRADWGVRESCLGKRDRLGLKHWFLVQVSQWNVNREFSTSFCPDSPWRSLWSPRLGQGKSVSGGHPAKLAPQMNSPLCCSSITCLLLAGKRLHPSDFCFNHFALGETGPECQDKRMS